jgi:hypothetical protein
VIEKKKTKKEEEVAEVLFSVIKYYFFSKCPVLFHFEAGKCRIRSWRT